jgi:type VI secretion system protein ImpL
MKTFFTNRWLLTTLGWIALGLVIWFLGPLFAFADVRPLESPMARAITILSVIIIWLMVLLIKQARSQKSSDAIVAQIADEPGPLISEGGDNNTAELRARFEDAIATLKNSRGKKGKINLYELPWYLIIGPPGSGKTTALQNSGLYFPLAAQHGQKPIEGVGGTRNCDWWFTDEAVLLDTAGRYVTQDSDSSADRSEWFGFLDLLKKHRRRRPINGAILCLSLSDVLSLSPREREQHIDAIKQRLQELYERSGTRVPVYVVFTKCDLLSGFVEFFDDLSGEARKQVWGTTFPLTDDQSVNPTESFEAEFDVLVARLNERVLDRVQQERDPTRRNLLYDFPAQVQNVKGILSEFLNALFQGSRYEHVPFVRGVYLTSGTQEGMPIDRLLGALSRNFGVSSQAQPVFQGQGRSFFVSRLFSDVIFREAELAGTNQKFERRRAWLQTALYASIGLVTLAFLGGWFLSYSNNQQGIENASAYVATVETGLQSLIGPAHLIDTVSPALANVRNVIAQFNLQEDDELEVADDSVDATPDQPKGATTDWANELDPPLSMRLGLHQGGKLANVTQITYRRLLRDQFLPRLMKTLEQQIQYPENPDFQYEALKRYLMLDSRDHYDGEAIKAWFKITAQTNPRGPSENVLMYHQHLDALFEERPDQLPKPLDEQLIAQARRDQLRIPLVDRVFGRLLRADTGDIKGFDLASAAGSNAPLVFVRKSGTPLSEPLAPLFTPEAYHKVFVPESARIAANMLDERWILGAITPTSGPQEALNMVSQVRDRYMAEYANGFEALIGDLTIAPFSSPRQAAVLLGALATEPSPITLLVNNLVAATDLATPGLDLPTAELGGTAKQAEQELGSIIGNSRIGRKLGATVRNLDLLEQRFDYLHRLRAADDGANPLQHILDLLRQLYEFMSLVDGQDSRGGVPPHVAESGEAVMRQLKNEANTQGQLLRELLGSTTDQAGAVAAGGSSTFINNAWNGGPKKFCDDAISNRFPINANTTKEIQLADFARFFAPNGIIDNFFVTHLAPLVDTSSNPWRARKTGDSAFSIKPSALRQFQNARAIRDAFFGSGSTPSVSFEMTPFGMDRSLELFTFTLDAYPPMSYSFGPKVATTYRWPSASGASELTIEMQPPGPTGQRMIRSSGPWALFKMINPNTLSPTDRPEHYRVAFEVDGRSVSYTLMAHSAYNPFSLRQLNQFRCPTTF